MEIMNLNDEVGHVEDPTRAAVDFDIFDIDHNGDDGDDDTYKSRRRSVVDIFTLLNQPIATFRSSGMFVFDDDQVISPAVFAPKQTTATSTATSSSTSMSMSTTTDNLFSGGLSSMSSSSNYYSQKMEVHSDELREYDIICGRNSAAFNSVGNRRFRMTMMINLQRYIDAPTREEKTKLIKSLVQFLHDDVGCRFLKKVDNTTYVTMSDKQIREKVGHSFRDLVIANRRREGCNAHNNKSRKNASANNNKSDDDQHKQSPLSSLSTTPGSEV